jgi:hypothetical protein
MSNHRLAGSKGSALGGSRAEPWPYFPSRGPRTGNGHEVYRDRHKQAPVVVVQSRKPADRRPRPQRWHDAVTELLALQAAYAAWFEALPESLRGTATADALEAIVELDLDTLAAITPPRGYGRD